MRNDLNSVLIEGTLTNDPDVGYIKVGSPVAHFTLACQRYVTRKTDGNEEPKPEISYFEIRVFDRQAEVCNEYLHAGRRVRVVGTLRQTDGQGQLFIRAEHVEFKPKSEKPKTAEAVA